MKPNPVRWTLLAATAAATLALAACHVTTSENIETNVSNLDVSVNDINMAEPANVAAPAPTTNATAPAPAAPGNDFDTSRTQDDADATGMTARTSQDEGNTGTPAQ